MLSQENKIWICPVCGYIHYGSQPPDECPVCGAMSCLPRRSQTRFRWRQVKERKSLLLVRELPV
jgi:rubredoxin